MTEHDPTVQLFVRLLIDRWNVGIKEGEIKEAAIDDRTIPKIQNILQNLGVTVCLENVDTIIETIDPFESDMYDRCVMKKKSSTNIKFIMTEVTDKTIKYPF